MTSRPHLTASDVVTAVRRRRDRHHTYGTGCPNRWPAVDFQALAARPGLVAHDDTMEPAA